MLWKNIRLQIFFKYRRKLSRSFSVDSFGKKLKVIFFGTDKFSLPSLDLIHQESRKNSCIECVSVVTTFKCPANPVKLFAMKNGLNLYEWPLTENALQHDIGIVVSFGHLIPEKIISMFPLGIINVHASLLPRWRGAAPIIYSLMNGDRETGVTIMKINPKHFDTGNILAQSKTEIHEDEKLPELHNRLAFKGAELLLHCLTDVTRYIRESKPQLESLVTYAPKVDRSLAEIHWNKMTARQVYNLHRALFSLKHIITKWRNQPVKLTVIQISKENERLLPEEGRPGHLEYNKKRACLIVQCCDKQQQIEVYTLMVGAKKMTASDFNNGFLSKVNKESFYFE